MDFNWRSIVGTVAPAIATALGGPLAGVATSAIAKAFGISDSPTEAEVVAAVKGATPEQLLALKQADQQFALEMQRLGVDLERISAADRDSARRREVDAHDSWTPRILAAVVVGCTLALEAWVLLKGYPVNIPGEVVGRVLGTFDSATVLVLSYYFGSSSRRDTQVQK